MGMLTAIVPALVNLISGFMENRQKIGEAKTAAKIELQKAGATGWTGRLIVIFWFYPAVACYVPWLREDAAMGFKLFAAAPEWYLAIVGAITVTLLGIDKVQGIRSLSRG
ncbi:hypothetical protein [uncultured Microbulbifer sp.]|uniref:hypothetical protein n=1 Tax=uncultured Microbulbifer sp. TaxID=348147 RepID=UPI002627CB06|nr:hypothetical protein [uncultured Microbulbifer sp.]